MKNYCVLFFFAFCTLSASAQCTQAVNNTLYTQNYSSIASQANDHQKLEFAKSFVTNNCVSSSQVKAIAMLFAAEDHRLTFCQQGYQNVVDKNDFYNVYDAFQSFSYAFKLHDYVLEQRKLASGNEQVEAPILNVESVLIFPNYNYPNATNYNGATGCSPPISNSDFMVLAKNVNSYPSDQDKIAMAAVIVQDNCLSMSQFMKLASLISEETLRKDFMMTNFENVHDLDNYPAAQQCFSYDPFKVDWMNYCLEYLTPEVPEITCEVDENKFKEMLKNIDNANFANDQIALVKNLNNNNCFSTSQVKRILEEFSFPENKLDAANILYPKCSDPENYYTLKGSFSFPSYESDFQDLLNGN
jgi:Domain of unknown function (DUF4476)